MSASHLARESALSSEPELIARAKAGDREAFARLYEPIATPLAAFLYRLIAAREEADDLAQETALQALEGITRFDGALSFRIWMFRMATSAAIDSLRGKKTWKPDAVILASKVASENATARRQFQRLHKAADHTTYDIRDHVDFCLTAMARTLPPHESAALLLTKVHGLSPEEAAQVMDVSPQVLRFRVEQARQALIELYDSRCGLINKQASCSQCAVFDTVLHGDKRHTEQALFQIGLDPQATAPQRAATFPQRLALTRSADPLQGQGAKLHEFLMNFIRDTNGY